MDELRALISDLTRAGVTWDIGVESFVGQGFTSMGHIENINNLYQPLLTFKSISSGGLLQLGDIPFYITVWVSIKAFLFWINDCCKSNQYQMGGDFNQAQSDEFNEIYRYVQERAEENHDNKWILTNWESTMIFPEWDDFMLSVMENDKFLADKHTPIQCLLRE